MASHHRISDRWFYADRQSTRSVRQPQRLSETPDHGGLIGTDGCSNYVGDRTGTSPDESAGCATTLYVAVNKTNTRHPRHNDCSDGSGR